MASHTWAKAGLSTARQDGSAIPAGFLGETASNQAPSQETPSHSTALHLILSYLPDLLDLFLNLQRSHPEPS